ncbi:hypothetical protein [Streptomyces sp. NPDC001536]|uniref:hypothetical protein n=1 Tax=Streptomyces sp. NPDC001536 TaxID=3364583 RepID=UPI0036B576FD
MSITGWRVHFTRRDPAWPREVSPCGQLVELLKQRVLVVYVINRLTRHLSVLDVIWIG